MDVKTFVGSGDRMMLFTLPAVVLGVIVNVISPTLFDVGGSSGAFEVFAIGLVALGVAIWACIDQLREKLRSPNQYWNYQEGEPTQSLCIELTLALRRRIMPP